MALPAMDHKLGEALVREFLVFRGFAHTLRSFEVDCAADPSQSFQADPIVELVFNVYIPGYEIHRLVELLDFLSRTLFSPADAHCQLTAKKLGAALRKAYIVHAIQKGRVDRVLQFFEEYGDSLLQSGEDWQPWFSIPYVKNPSTDPRFQVFFSREWLDTLIVSFRNFLAQVIDGTRLPALLKLLAKRYDYRSLKQDLKELREKCALLEATMKEKDDEIFRLTKALSQSGQPFAKGDPSDDQSALTTNENLGEGSTWSTSVSAKPNKDLEESTEKFRVSLINGSADCSANWPREDQVYHEVSVASQETFSGHTSAITRCRFSPTGSNIASASSDGTVRIWTYEASASTSRNATIYCGAEVMSLDWEHKSGRLLLLGTAERGIKAWNVDAKRVVCHLSTNASFPRVLDIRCSPTDPVFVSAESSVESAVDNGEQNSFGSLTIWNMRAWKALNVLPLGEDPPVVNSICFNHNGKMVAAAANDGVIRLFDMSGCLPITGWPAHDGAVKCVRFAPNQTSIFTMGDDGKVFEWSLHNQGQILQSFNASKFTVGSGGDHYRPRHEMALACHGSSLLLTSNLDYAPLFDFHGETPKAQRTAQHGGPITSVDWHPHLNMYLAGSADHSIHVTSVRESRT